MYFSLVLPIKLEAQKLRKELLDARLKLEQACFSLKKQMVQDPKFKLECIEIWKDLARD